MPRITRFTSADVSAPDQTTVGQNIDIPRGAFGELEAEAIAQLGGTITSTAEALGMAQHRQQKREDAIAASKRYQELDLASQEEYEGLKQNPGDLKTFVDRTLDSYDKRVEEYAKDLSPGAREMFLQKTLSGRTTRGKQAVSWKTKEFITQGRNAVRSELDLNVRAAGADIENLADYYKKAETTTAEAIAAGFLSPTKGKSAEALVEDEVRKVSFEVANDMLNENPALLHQLLEDDTLRGLTSKEKRTFQNQALNAVKNLDEKAQLQKLSSLIVNNKEFAEKYSNGELTYKDVDEMERSETIDPRLAEILKDDLTTPEEVEYEELVDKKVRDMKATEEARKRRGLPPREKKPSNKEKVEKEKEMYARFLSFGVTKKDGKTKLKNANEQLSDLLDFQVDVMAAASSGLLDRDKASKWMRDLLPILGERIKSKHFQGQENWIRADRKPDIYSTGFTQVLDMLEKSPKANTLYNQVRALEFVVQIAEAKGVDQIEDPVEKHKALMSIGKDAVDLLNKTNYPALAHVEKMPDTVISTRKPTAAELLLANKDNKKYVDAFIKRFGEDAYKKVIGE